MIGTRQQYDKNLLEHWSSFFFYYFLSLIAFLLSSSRNWYNRIWQKKLFHEKIVFGLEFRISIFLWQKQGKFCSKNADVLKEYLMHLFAQQGSGYRLRWLRSVNFTGLATLFLFLFFFNPPKMEQVCISWIRPQRKVNDWMRFFFSFFFKALLDILLLKRK